MQRARTSASVTSRARDGRAPRSSPPEALAFVAELHRRFERRAPRAARARAPSARRGSTPASCPDFLPETREIREGDWRVAPVPPDLQDRRVEITGPADRKMVINALNSGARVLHGRLRGRELADLGEHASTGQANLDRRDRAHDRARDAGEQELPPERRDRDAARPPARLAPASSSTSSSTASRSRRSLFDFGLYLFHNAQRAARARHAARTSTCRSSRATSRRGSGTTSSTSREDALGIAARHDQGDRADRDDPRRVRDGRDPLRAARPLGRPERGPLGLHLQHHQEVPRRGPSSCCPTARR